MAACSSSRATGTRCSGGSAVTDKMPRGRAAPASMERAHTPATEGRRAADLRVCAGGALSANRSHSVLSPSALSSSLYRPISLIQGSPVGRGGGWVRGLDRSGARQLQARAKQGQQCFRKPSYRCQEGVASPPSARGLCTCARPRGAAALRGSLLRLRRVPSLKQAYGCFPPISLS